MTIGRRSGAPRLIDWTGERCVPWAPDIQVVYEHMHRYLWAAGLVGERRVLDLASGEGFGAAILAQTAESVDGIEIDATTVDHAALNYGSERIRFTLGDAQDLSAYADGSFGAVVAFEMIEHVADQERVVQEVARVLAPDGLLIISTPDRRAYSTGESRENPFHVRELDLPEFRQLLGAHFPNVGVWGQRTITGSVLSAVDACEESVGSPTHFIERDGDEWSPAAGLSLLYLVAIASRAQLPSISADSTLADADLTLMRAAEARVEDVRRQFLAEQEKLRGALVQTDADRAIGARRLQDRDLEIDSLARRLDEARADAGSSRETASALAVELAAERVVTARMTGSVTWRAFQAIRWRLFEALGGEHGIPVRLLQASLRGVGSLRTRPGVEAEVEAGRRRFKPLAFTEFGEPEVSLIVPVYSGAELTSTCLESILRNTNHVSYEVIVVDDGKDRAVTELLSGVTGAKVIRNKQNLGYLRSVNRGAAAARGDWLVLCNNDIEVTRGWLGHLLECARTERDAAIVTPMYLAPDGLISEAGAIIWRDGTGWNVGRGQRSDHFHFACRREVDYGSAAALLVDTSFWKQVGGFDERFAPMYYEDVDLAFQARAHGHRVLYEPKARVVHREGSTAGTDIAAGHKRHQEHNRATFTEKWRAELATQANSDVHHVRRAASRKPGQRVLILDHRVPCPDRDAGSLRMREVVNSLRRLGRQVVFWPDDCNPIQPYTDELQQLGVEVWWGAVDVRSELITLAGELEMVILSRPQIASRWLDTVRELAPGTPLVYDTVDLHWLREARRHKDPRQRDDPARTSKAGALREIERALITASDATLTVTADEAERVRTEVPGARVWIAPTVNPVHSSVPGPESRSGIVFVGGFEHPPNTAAAIRLVRAVMPIVWETLPDVSVTIVGGAVPPEVAALADPRVDITGWVADVEPLLDGARATVAPITYGAGLKGKVTQALAFGLPVVTTGIGAEGLGAADGRELLIAEDDSGLAERTIRVLSDDTLWRQLSGSGRALADRVCSPAVMDAALRDLLGAMASSREGDRASDRSRNEPDNLQLESALAPRGPQ